MNTEEVRTGLDRAWDNIVMFVPQLLAFLFILIVGYFVARFLGKLVDRVLEKTGVERLVERGGIRQALNSTGYHVSDILGKVAFYTIFLFVLQLAFGVFGPNPVSDLLTRFIVFLPNIFVAILIVVVAMSVGAAVKEIVQASLGGLSYGKWLANAAWFAIATIGVFAALDQLEIAPQIVVGLFYALLAIVVGVSVVAIGGGGIGPMRNVWERMLARAQQEAPRLAEEVRAQADSGPRMM